MLKNKIFPLVERDSIVLLRYLACFNVFVQSSEALQQWNAGLKQSTLNVEH